MQGDALSLLSAVLFSVYSVLLKHLMPRHDKASCPSSLASLILVAVIAYRSSECVAPPRQGELRHTPVAMVAWALLRGRGCVAPTGPSSLANGRGRCQPVR